MERQLEINADRLRKNEKELAEENEKLRNEINELKNKIQHQCDIDKQIDYIMKINMYLTEKYKEDILSDFEADEGNSMFSEFKRIFDLMYEEENKKYPLPWNQYGFGAYGKPSSNKKDGT